MTAVEDLLARYEDAGAMHYGWVAHDLRTAIAADARAASQNLECRTCGVRGRKAAREEAARLAAFDADDSNYLDCPSGGNGEP